MPNPTPSQHAVAAADAIQLLNRSLLDTKDISAPEISATVQAVIRLVDRMPQALSHLSARLVREQKAERIRMDDGSDPAKAAMWVETFLTDAETDVVDAAKSLHAAGSLLFKMGAPYDPTDDDEGGGAERCACGGTGGRHKGGARCPSFWTEGE
ncbi:hypothetical protein [Streptomyces sp. NPDC056401]|uniref:hypothetical protein n=1 Tax=Streptomyces sp. NPDC056401 TaxID=3345809 RepID=UPI0035D5BF8C